MRGTESRRAVAAAIAAVSSQGLAGDEAVVLQDSNKLTVRLLPADVLARVAPVTDQVAQLEIDVAQGLAANGSPVAALDPRVEPRVHERDGFAVTLWKYYEPLPRKEIAPVEYAKALERLHAGMRGLKVPTPHVTDRVEQAQRLVASRERTPELPDGDREVLAATLRDLSGVTSGGAQQILHGEPHPGNVLSTTEGPRFIDLETCCRGPVEFDLAHAPEEVGEHYPGVDQNLLRACRILVLAIITTWRWDRDDQLPGGRELAAEWLGQIRTARA
ncbi:phosphotransferase [Kutzneria sp. CA-103260]|uniref:phosphotransferase n=1 Tax=Kutzneria sp. CA-103260 TaxID=2802641 RepID=UPI001BA568FF|nr:phosphotransferase [Kutzneria sp. CA-103260]QUQ64773.1 Stress response kinase A [Kutzneria sp. CA-103260]